MAQLLRPSLKSQPVYHTLPFILWQHRTAQLEFILNIPDGWSLRAVMVQTQDGSVIRWPSECKRLCPSTTASDMVLHLARNIGTLCYAQLRLVFVSKDREPFVVHSHPIITQTSNQTKVDSLSLFFARFGKTRNCTWEDMHPLFDGLSQNKLNKLSETEAVVELTLENYMEMKEVFDTRGIKYFIQWFLAWIKLLQRFPKFRKWWQTRLLMPRINQAKRDSTLQGSPGGTFLLRLSKDTPGSVAVSLKHQTGEIEEFAGELTSDALVAHILQTPDFVSAVLGDGQLQHKDLCLADFDKPSIMETSYRRPYAILLPAGPLSAPASPSGINRSNQVAITPVDLPPSVTSLVKCIIQDRPNLVEVIIKERIGVDDFLEMTQEDLDNLYPGLRLGDRRYLERIQKECGKALGTSQTSLTAIGTPSRSFASRAPHSIDATSTAMPPLSPEVPKLDPSRGSVGEKKSGENKQPLPHQTFDSLEELEQAFKNQS